MEWAAEVGGRASGGKGSEGEVVGVGPVGADGAGATPLEDGHGEVVEALGFRRPREELPRRRRVVLLRSRRRRRIFSCVGDHHRPPTRQRRGLGDGRGWRSAYI